jgi:hypothetical protein
VLLKMAENWKEQSLHGIFLNTSSPENLSICMNLMGRADHWMWNYRPLFAYTLRTVR